MFLPDLTSTPCFLEDLSTFKVLHMIIKLFRGLIFLVGSKEDAGPVVTYQTLA